MIKAILVGIGTVTNLHIAHVKNVYTVGFNSGVVSASPFSLELREHKKRILKFRIKRFGENRVTQYVHGKEIPYAYSLGCELFRTSDPYEFEFEVPK